MCALCVLLTIHIPLDIVIVDTHSDINIYKDLVQGQMDPGETNDRSEPSGCCGGAQEKNDTEEDLLECDFNEWAGESRLFDC